MKTLLTLVLVALLLSGCAAVKAGLDLIGVDAALNALGSAATKSPYVTSKLTIQGTPSIDNNQCQVSAGGDVLIRYGSSAVVHLLEGDIETFQEVCDAINNKQTVKVKHLPPPPGSRTITAVKFEIMKEGELTL